MKERLDSKSYTSWKDMCIYLGRYAFAVEKFKGNSVLDVACGTGFGSNYLLNQDAMSVIGADYSDIAIGYAHTRYSKKGLKFVIVDAQQMPFPDNSFDTVVSMETIEHLPDYQAFLRECKRVLRPGGVFICSTPNKNVSMPVTGELNPFHIKEFNADELNNLLNQYFDNVSLYGYLRWTKKSTKGMIVEIPISALYALPLSLQSFFLNIISFITRYIFRGYHPVSLEDIDEKDFAKLISQSYKPFPLNEATPEYLFAIGYKSP